jgi:hypothetical protein
MPRKNQTQKFRRAIWDSLSLWRKEIELAGFTIVSDLIWKECSSILIAAKYSPDIKEKQYNNRLAHLSSMVSKNPRKKWKVFVHATGAEYAQCVYPYGTLEYESLETATYAIGYWLEHGAVWAVGLVGGTDGATAGS